MTRRMTWRARILKESELIGASRLQSDVALAALTVTIFVGIFIVWIVLAHLAVNSFDTPGFPIIEFPVVMSAKSYRLPGAVLAC